MSGQPAQAGSGRALTEATWPECGTVEQVRARPIAGADAPLLLVPTGSLEQHGPHLPLGVDAMVATAVAHQVAARFDMGRIFVAPPVSYGASGEHEGFPGTISIGQEALTQLLIELGRSACRWAGGLVFVNGHGGNAMSLVRAVALLRQEGRRVAWVPCAAGGDAHAGLTETSLLLAVTPELVRADLAEPGNPTPVSELLESMRRVGVAGVSANGVLGDPRGASAEHGRRLLARMVEQVAALVSTFTVGSDGRLRVDEPAAALR